MADCEICGRDTVAQNIIEIEGAQMSVCINCARGKKVIERIDPTPEPEKKGWQRPRSSQDERDIVDNYGSLIRHAREGMGLSLKVVAEKINEKESTLLRVEEEKMRPSDALVKKIERELGIKLTESAVRSSGKLQLGRDEPITLGDAMIKKDGRK
ncbi:MAG: TIGR00270 family protein [Candidatus Micrarchaeota archaeon]|nr:TIGR00270 family protein [Candidatus Micrarchaeota archaeon]